MRLIKSFPEKDKINLLHRGLIDESPPDKDKKNQYLKENEFGCFEGDQ